MQIAEEEFAEIPGQDAFLDVLTNMVGIIILLVVVMGLRTSRAALAPPPGEAAPTTHESTFATLEAARRKALEAQNQLGDLMNQVVRVRGLTEAREHERAMLTTYVAAAERDIDRRRAELSVEQQRDFDLRQKLVAAQVKLDELTQIRVGLMSQAAEVHVIENRPTPIARQSTGNRLYLHLRGGHVAVLPFDSIESRLREDFERNLWRAREKGRFSQTIGPFDGFRIRYFVERSRAVVRVHDVAELDQRGDVTSLTRFEFIPVSQPIGETVDQALAPDSELAQRLNAFPPDRGVVAIMVYPDSLDDLHRIKKRLYDAGYSVAEAPIPNDQWVSFSTRGGYQLFAQ